MASAGKYDRAISLGALTALTGYVLSGPVGFIIVKMTYPQPEWISSATFSRHYHVVQDLPYYFGFLLIFGMLIVSTGLYLNLRNESTDHARLSLMLALCCSVVFCVLISFNYICQTTFIRNLALHYKAEYDPIIATFSMSNPFSLSWAIEMWGYAFLGISTALASVYYQRRSNLIALLMILNGIISVGSAIMTIADVFWILTDSGLVAYFAWNFLMIFIMILIRRDAVNTRTVPFPV
jgi:hypothetical protein